MQLRVASMNNIFDTSLSKSVAMSTMKANLYIATYHVYCPINEEEMY